MGSDGDDAMKAEAKGLVLCDHHAEQFGMRGADSILTTPPSNDVAIYVQFALSTEAVPQGAACHATLGDSAREHDGVLRLYTIQRVDRREA
jgi:hypothetical protein